MPSSVAVTSTTYEACTSRFGEARNVKTPVVALIAKLARSAPPDIEKVTSSATSSSEAATVATAVVAFSA